MDENLDDFFKKYIYGTEPLDYEKAFQAIGLKVVKIEKTEAFFGTSLSESNGKLIVSRVQSQSAAERAGIGAKDEIIAINGFRTNQSGFNEFIGRIQVGEKFEIMVARDGKLMNMNAVMGEITKVNYSYQLDNDLKKAQLFEKWLRTEK
jgi:predicted metalloprotease with PDZ domain